MFSIRYQGPGPLTFHPGAKALLRHLRETFGDGEPLQDTNPDTNEVFSVGVHFASYWDYDTFTAVNPAGELWLMAAAPPGYTIL